MIECASYLCFEQFDPEHGHQKYCSPNCNAKNRDWMRIRGAHIVPLLVDFSTADLLAYQRKLKEEIANARADSKSC